MKADFVPFWESIKGTVGTAAPFIGAVLSWQEHLEWGLRIISLLIGIAVGVLTLWSWGTKRRREAGGEEDENPRKG